MRQSVNRTLQTYLRWSPKELTTNLFETVPSMFLTQDIQVMPSTDTCISVCDCGRSFASKPMSSIASAASSGEMRVGSMTSLADFPSRDTEILMTPGLEERIKEEDTKFVDYYFFISLAAGVNLYEK